VLLDKKFPLKLAIGHELVPDEKGPALFAHVVDILFTVEDADIENFLAGNLSQIQVNPSQKGNSYQDLLLTRIGFLFAESIQNGTISTPEEMAQWLEMALTPEGLENVDNEKFNEDKSKIEAWLKDFNDRAAQSAAKSNEPAIEEEEE
jgi:hypothetical protein